MIRIILCFLLALIPCAACAQLFEVPNNVIINGHEAAKNPGVIPTATLCGAQPDAGSSDTAGTITNVGTTTCTITFTVAYVVAPSCIVVDLTAGRATLAVAVTTAAITITGGTAADRYAWRCTAKQGL